MLCLGEQLDGFAQLFLQMVGKVQGVSDKYQKFTHVKHKEIIFEGKCCSSYIYIAASRQEFLSFYIDPSRQVLLVIRIPQASDSYTSSYPLRFANYSNINTI